MKKFDEYLDESVEDFVDDTKLADVVFKDLRIAANDIVMKTLIPKMKQVEQSVIKKHKLGKTANMFVKNYGTAAMHDILRELIGQELVSSGNLKKRFMSRT